LFLLLLGDAAWRLDARIDLNLFLSPFQGKGATIAPSWTV